ncbi:genetic suppressor element 1-like [Heptranchias perlo]|uniref:genetic suppressor element 1-like n=1 Tax=Heptranchias perlo TaxID=212740 RepID=UPI003559C610
MAAACPRGSEQQQLKPSQGPARDRPGGVPAQRRRKSEYPRRRSCISFTFSGAEPSGSHPEGSEEPMDNRHLQRFGATHRENGEAPLSRQLLRTCGQALGELVCWTHLHCQGCLHPPSLRYLPPDGAALAVWACQAGHTYRWQLAGADRSPRRRAKRARSSPGAPEPQEAGRGPSPEREEEEEEEAERGPSPEREEAEREEEEEEEEEEESEGDSASDPVATLRIVECELEEEEEEEEGPGGVGPEPGWKVIPCKVERSEEEAEQGPNPSTLPPPNTHSPNQAAFALIPRVRNPWAPFPSSPPDRSRPSTDPTDRLIQGSQPWADCNLIRASW